MITGYLYVAGALIAGVTKGYCGKKTSTAVRTMIGTLLFNAVRMLLCIPIGLLFVYAANALPALRIDHTTLLISAVSGISTALFVVLWIVCVRTGAYMMVDVFITLGTAVPIALCACFFSESVRIMQMIGFALLVFAAYIMCTYNNTLDNRPRLSVGNIVLLLLCGASNGVTAFSQKWFRIENQTDVSVFNFYTYLFASAVLLICFLVLTIAQKHAHSEKPQEMQKTETTASDHMTFRLGIYVVVMSACLFLHSFCSTKAAGYLPSTQLYPLMQGCSLVLSMLMSAFCFGERITSRSLIGIVTAFAAMLCINLL